MKLYEELNDYLQSFTHMFFQSWDQNLGSKGSILGSKFGIKRYNTSGLLLVIYFL